MKPFDDTRVIRYALADTPCGPVFVAATERGVCMLQIIETTELPAALDEAQRLFPRCELVEDAHALHGVYRQIDALVQGRDTAPVPLDLRGTPFQQRVWQALCQVPRGQTATYTVLAERVGCPTAVRAVASACARNPVSLFVPCHRIVRRDGGLGGYRWGLDRKRELLRREQGPR
jgi:AraC family transcriptional regulator, regulatory protein of adaptative response / methylated-DNA-[protein]-cysteine methyltransferase